MLFPIFNKQDRKISYNSNFFSSGKEEEKRNKGK